VSIAGTELFFGSLEPVSPPAPNGVTLDEINKSLPSGKGFTLDEVVKLLRNLQGPSFAY